MADVINELIARSVRHLGATAISITHDMASAQDRPPHRHAVSGQDHLAGPVAQIDHSGNPYVEQFIHGRGEGLIKLDIRAA